MTIVEPQGRVHRNGPELATHQRILQETGPAVGRITGLNHLVLFTQDMNEGVKFYRDILGLRVVRTVQFSTTADGLRSAAQHSTGNAATSSSGASSVAVELKLRQVFFELGNGELFSLYEVPNVSRTPAASVNSVLWPVDGPTSLSKPTEPQKMDHLSLNVNTHADVVWFHSHLIASGVAVSDITERRGANNTHRFITSIYFYDPSGNPLEISTFDAADGLWNSYDFSEWFMDEQPVPALLLDDRAEPAPVRTPRFVGRIVQ